MNMKSWKRWSGLAVFLVTAGFVLSGATIGNADTKFSADVKKAMAEMKSKAAQMGAPKQEGAQLFFGSAKMNGNYELVDALKKAHNCTATLFVKKGDGFVRISTNVMKDSNRAIGTVLDPNGPAIAAIRQGKAFYGVVDILGKKYDTGYEPIKNAGGDIIGIYYIGYPL